MRPVLEFQLVQPLGSELPVPVSGLVYLVSESVSVVAVSALVLQDLVSVSVSNFRGRTSPSDYSGCRRHRIRQPTRYAWCHRYRLGSYGVPKRTVLRRSRCWSAVDKMKLNRTAPAEPILSAELTYSAHWTVSWLVDPHAPRALRGKHEHHHSSNNPSGRFPCGWWRLLRTATPVGDHEA